MEKSATPEGLQRLFMRTRFCIRWGANETDHLHLGAFLDIISFGCPAGGDLSTELEQSISRRCGKGIATLSRSRKLATV